MSLEELGRRLAAEQDEQLAESDVVARVRDRIADGPRVRRRRPLAGWTAGLAAAALAVAAVVLIVVRSRPHAPLSFSVAGETGSSGAWISADHATVTAVRFSDGSLFAFRDDARARVESVTPDGAHVVMERGAVSADVVHRATSRWSVLAGPYEVRVTGTQFEVSWDPAEAHLEVHVTRGSVRVTGGGLAPHDVRTGEVFTNAPARTTESHASATAAAALPAPSADVQPSAHAAVAAPTPRWRDLAAAGRFSDAIEEVERTGVDGVIARSGPADLLALADAARLSSHAEIAERSLLALRKRFPGDPRAARAAFDLGRIAFDQRRDYASAATWFTTYLDADPGGTFDREAAGRLIEARQKMGDAAGARAAAASYLRRYPNGPHAPLAKSLMTE
jgi:transmembrane sensor